MRESDESLRERLLYVAGDGERLAHEIVHSEGRLLDELAWRFGLKRREVLN